MKTGFALTLGTIATLAAGGAAHAGTIQVDTFGETLYLNSGPVTNLFGGTQHSFAASLLQDVHHDLHQSGINTDGVITVLLADTDSGLSLMALFDDNTSPLPSRSYSSIDMSSTAPTTSRYYVNDMNDPMVMAMGTGFQTANAAFQWRDNRGDAFAWTNLHAGDELTFGFDSVEGEALSDDFAFQFVNWTGQGWEIVGTGEFFQGEDDKQYFFAASVVPLPAPVLLGLAGLGVVAFARRRKLA